MEEINMKDMVNVCKQYGFIYQGSEIYGGLANTWDYGPLGSLLKNNIKNTWRKRFIQERDNAYELDSAILMHPKVWEASGHVQSFSDPLIDCKNCKTRHRVDNLISEYNTKIDVDAMSEKEMMTYITINKVPCPKCGKSDFTSLREFNLMFKTNRGVTEEKQNIIYLRPENALRYHPHEKLAHYAKEACDIDYKFPFGWGEINGTHNRTDFDLTRHQEYSGEKMYVIDEETKKKYIPYIIESTVGADRLVLAMLFNSYKREELKNGEIREFMSFHPAIAPYKVAVLPLVKKYHGELAQKVYQQLRKSFPCDYDESGTIGKRYRREDIMGTPWCITIDDESLSKNIVTIRNRDTMEQIAINIDDVKDYIKGKIDF